MFPSKFETIIFNIEHSKITASFYDNNINFTNKNQGDLHALNDAYFMPPFL